MGAFYLDIKKDLLDKILSGVYQQGSIIPNEYELVYTWGGQKVDGKTITVQDYKGTVIDRSRWNSNSATEASHDCTWYNENVDTR